MLAGGSSWSRYAVEAGGTCGRTRKLARAFLESILTGKDVTHAFLEYGYALAEKATGAALEIIPDDNLELAEQTFDWQIWKRS